MTVNTRGATAFGGAIGNTAVLASLTTDAQSGLPGEKTVLGGGTLNATTVDFKDDVVLAADTTVTGTTVSFEKTVNSDRWLTPRALTVNAGGVTTFGGAIGNTAALVSLTTDAQGGLPGEETVLGGGTLNATTVDFKDDVGVLGGRYDGDGHDGELREDHQQRRPGDAAGVDDQCRRGHGLRRRDRRHRAAGQPDHRRPGRVAGRKDPLDTTRRSMPPPSISRTTS